MSNAAHQWNALYGKGPTKRYPDEAVIRIFYGAYKNQKMPKPKPGDTILDVGCGADGNNFPVFADLGMKIAGCEITQEIVDTLVSKLGHGSADLRVGTCANLPWPDATFDYLISWNSCYYMNTGVAFEDHVSEMARVIKPGGWIVCSVPKASSFIFKNAEPTDNCYVTIRDDYFDLRNGELMRYFPDQTYVVSDFKSHFTNFCHASINIDWYDGLAYNWHVFTAERRT